MAQAEWVPIRSQAQNTRVRGSLVALESEATKNTPRLCRLRLNSQQSQPSHLSNTTRHNQAWAHHLRLILPVWLCICTVCIYPTELYSGDIHCLLSCIHRSNFHVHACLWLFLDSYHDSFLKTLEYRIDRFAPISLQRPDSTVIYKLTISTAPMASWDLMEVPARGRWTNGRCDWASIRESDVGKPPFSQSGDRRPGSK